MSTCVACDAHYQPDSYRPDTTPGFLERLDALAEEANLVVVAGDCAEGQQGWKGWRVWHAQRVVAGLDPDRRIIYLRGNHDPTEYLLYHWHSEDRKVAALHGHALPLLDPDTLAETGVVTELDPWLDRHLGGLVGRVVGWLERRISADADVVLAGWYRRLHRWLWPHAGGRHGQWHRYAVPIAEWARRYGFTVVYFGHLHERWEITIGGTRLVCCGSCVNGEMDFVEIDHA